MTDIFRPHTQPSQRIYDAFVMEADKRQSRINNGENWIHLERLAVFRETRDYCQENGLQFPTMEQIEYCELRARPYRLRGKMGNTHSRNDRQNQ